MKDIGTKLRKLSLPTLFGLIIAICMLIIFVSEHIGLACKEKNLILRHHHAEIILKAHNENNNLEIEKKGDYEEEIQNNVYKVKRLEMENMLIKGAESQVLYEQSKDYN